MNGIEHFKIVNQDKGPWDFYQTRDGMNGLIAGTIIAMSICVLNLIVYVIVEMAGPEAPPFNPIVAIFISSIWLVVVVVLLLIFVGYRDYWCPKRH